MVMDEESKESSENKEESEAQELGGVNNELTRVKARAKSEMEFFKDEKPDKDSDEEDVEDMFMDAMGEIQKASVILNETMR